MAWEQIVRGSFGRRSYGPLWDSEPRIAVNKTGITFNAIAVQAFSLVARESLCVSINRVERKVAFKSAISPEEVELGFVLQGEAGEEARGKSLHIGARQIVKAFPECIGHDFPIKLNRGQLLMESDLRIAT